MDDLVSPSDARPERGQIFVQSRTFCPLSRSTFLWAVIRHNEAQIRRRKIIIEPLLQYLRRNLLIPMLSTISNDIPMSHFRWCENSFLIFLSRLPASEVFPLREIKWTTDRRIVQIICYLRPSVCHILLFVVVCPTSSVPTDRRPARAKLSQTNYYCVCGRYESVWMGMIDDWYE